MSDPTPPVPTAEQIKAAYEILHSLDGGAADMILNRDATKIARLLARAEKAEGDANTLREEVEFTRDVIHGGYAHYLSSDDAKAWAIIRNATDALRHGAGEGEKP